MRPIDGDALLEILTTAIRNMKGMAKLIAAEDDPEIQMEIKAYTDIADGVKDMPTIEPERKTGKWIPYNGDKEDWLRSDGTPVFMQCSECHAMVVNNFAFRWNFCPECGSKTEKQP